jgi:hypothetical protein
MALRSTPRALGISQYGEGRGPDSHGTTFDSMDTLVQLENVTKRYGAQHRRSLVSWVAAADAAGLDEDGTAALVAHVLRDFRKRHAGTVDRRGARRHEAEGVA